jgi:metal-responsive CopG/Arc/MetJ family transcriptional regulator
MGCYNVMAILVNERSNSAKELQDVLTRYGCIISVRLGLHQAGNACSEEGLIILQLCGSSEEIKALEDNLNSIKGVKAKSIELSSE